MSQLWVPPRVSRELRDATERHKREVLEAARRDATLDYWDRELKKIDPALTIIKAVDDARVPGLKAGYYHIVREVENGPPSILPIVGENGEFVEPTSRILDLLRAGDLQNPRAMAERRRRDDAAERAREKARQDGHEERVEEMLDRWKSMTQTRVSMSRDTPWSQNVQGRRGARKAA